MIIARPKTYIYIITLIALTSCIEHFKFEGKNELPAFIIEGSISDISSNEHKSLFYKPRYFSIKLKYSGAVENVLDQKISGAEVELISDLDEHWDYTEDEIDPGVYYLYYPAFEAQQGVSYKINIKLENGDEYESNYDQMPYGDVRGTINEEEATQLQYKQVSRETAIRPVVGLNVSTQLPDFSDSSFRYFRWDFEVTWKLVAEFSYPSDPNGECWINDFYHYDDYVLSKLKGASSSLNLFFLQTSGNRRAKFGFATRIRQQEISEKHHQFWTDLQNQQKQSELFAPPPYNIYSNITSVNNENEAYGFFGVVNEEYYIWYYDSKSLSYIPFFIEECFVPPNFDPAPWCGNCLGYGTGGLIRGEELTNQKPKWWTF